ncbi:hypothetical protein RI844_05780 [Thalassotalea fonticola]|uniref:Glycoamylase-like domain-containing protein n=1 Tax=Thalassotalea fonticola TaxID=3065649 RepID=A0ABZ0GST1_9GAMM|nr:hypothetical protein RI844_05780 [Colwelliaceae bacterium S1-1]
MEKLQLTSSSTTTRANINTGVNPVVRFIRYLPILLFAAVFHTQAQSDDEIINKLYRDSYQFWQQIREPNGVYRDGFQLSNKQSVRGSIANAGMGLVALAIGHAQGWQPNAENLALQTLTTLSGNTPGFTPARNAAGCYMHFFNVHTGQAMSKDFSPIDTDIMLLGATFIKNYFSKNQQIGQLVDQLLASVDQAKFIGDPIKGQIALSMNANGEPSGAWTIPFNEYMIVAWLAKQQSKDDNSAANQLWSRHYQTPKNLKKALFGKAQTPVLSVSNKRYVTMFTFLFNYYLVHHFSNSPEYVQAMKNAAKADFSWWQEQDIKQWQPYEWGTGAGATITGYNADRIFNRGSRDENPYQIVSPHILSGFSPVKPSVKADLVAMYRAGPDKAIYQLSPEVSVLWRYSLKQKHWRAKAVQGVDFSTMLFGLAALPDFLGADFFNRYNTLE